MATSSAVAPGLQPAAGGFATLTFDGGAEVLYGIVQAGPCPESGTGGAQHGEAFGCVSHQQRVGWAAVYLVDGSTGGGCPEHEVGRHGDLDRMEYGGTTDTPSGERHHHSGSGPPPTVETGGQGLVGYAQTFGQLPAATVTQ